MQNSVVSKSKSVTFLHHRTFPYNYLLNLLQITHPEFDILDLLLLLVALIEAGTASGKIIGNIKRLTIY